MRPHLALKYFSSSKQCSVEFHRQPDLFVFCLFFLFTYSYISTVNVTLRVHSALKLLLSNYLQEAVQQHKNYLLCQYTNTCVVFRYCCFKSTLDFALAKLIT